MKKKCLISTIILCALSLSVYAQIPEQFHGTWDYKGPTGEYGYDAGVVEIDKESVVFIFTGNSYKYPSDWVKYESDTLKHNMDVDGAFVECFLKVEDASNLIGFAEWEGGETALILSRKKAE